MSRKIIVIVGPTASGKSDVAIELARSLNAEVVSADSMQIYTGMNIGTAKLTQAEMRGVPHWLIDVTEPEKPFSAAAYQELAREALDSIWERGHIPIIAGGTGLYVRAVIDGLEFPESDESGAIRANLEKRANNEGVESLYAELTARDPQAAEFVDAGNKRRIIRALEVIELTGQPFSGYHTNWKNRQSVYDVHMFGLSVKREILYERINSRVDSMITLGLIDEVRGLMERGYTGFLTSQQAIGYKELIAYIEDESTLEEAVERIKQRTRNYAKRQMTWFNADPRITWVDITAIKPVEVAALIRQRLMEDGFIEQRGQYDF